MKKILNNKKAYIGFILITIIIYIFLIYGGIQKGITKTFQYEYDNSRPFMEAVMRPGGYIDIIFIYNILFMIACVMVQIAFTIVSEKKKLKICILIAILTISLTLVPIKIHKTMWKGGTIQDCKYNSLLLNKTYRRNEKWPFMKNISY